MAGRVSLPPATIKIRRGGDSGKRGACQVINDTKIGHRECSDSASNRGLFLSGMARTGRERFWMSYRQTYWKQEAKKDPNVLRQHQNRFLWEMDAAHSTKKKGIGVKKRIQ